MLINNEVMNVVVKTVSMSGFVKYWFGHMPKHENQTNIYNKAFVEDFDNSIKEKSIESISFDTAKVLYSMIKDKAIATIVPVLIEYNKNMGQSIVSIGEVKNSFAVYLDNQKIEDFINIDDALAFVKSEWENHKKSGYEIV